MTKKNRIIITLNDYVYNQLIAVAHETNLTKSQIINEVLNRTLVCRVKRKYFYEIIKPEYIRFDIVDK